MSLSYDANFRLISLTDSLGQVTTISYGADVLGDAGFYKIATVTDPFQRSASFAYDANGRLQKITDIIGITSQFTYQGTSTFINSLTTPYGVTTFAFGDNSTDSSLGSTRWLNTTYPDGNTTRTEYNETATPSGLASNGYADAAGIPNGMYSGNGINNYMQFRNTYYWDKQAMKSYPGNYAQAQVTHWLHTSDINTCSDIQESLKKVDQNRIWYNYAGEISSIQASDDMLSLPTQKGRIMDDGTTQLFQYQYNSVGKVVQQLDPLGRETDYTYALNNIDLLTVKQKNGSNYDLLSSSTYNNQHEPLMTTDASGQTTYYSYNTAGQITSMIDAKGEKISYYYSNGYLTSVIGPVSGASTTFTYDGFGRVLTATDSQGYTIKTNYDVMDRPTLVTYPDGTNSQMNYSILDLQYSKDRLGHLTRYFYNSLRQPIETLDAQGNITTTNWSLSAGPSSVVDPAGHKTLWQYDTENRPVEKDYPDATKVLTSYENTTNRVKTVTDANGNVATLTYNLDNTVLSISYASGAGVSPTPTVSYTYDPTYPRISTMSDPVTGTITYNYNLVTGALGSNLLESVYTPLATISYKTSGGAPAYDQLGRSLGTTIGGVSSSVAYDSLGRVTSETNALTPSGSFNYAYLNDTGRVTSITNPNGQKTIYTYQDSTTTPNEPRLTEIKNENASSAIISKFDYGYDAQGQITSWTQQTDSNDPQNWANQYDNEGKLTNVNVKDTVSNAVLHQYAYIYDAAGNRTSEQVDGNVTGATYNNNLNQLTGQSGGGKMVFSGSTGTVPSMVTVGGNLASTSYNTNFTGIANVNTGTNNVPVIAHDVNGNTSTNTYQVVIPPTSSAYTYDLNGNMLTDGIRTYGWDAKNELVSIVYNSGANAGNHTEFTYNGAGARVKIVERTGTAIGSGTITSTKQYYAGEEFDGSGNVTKRYFSRGEQRIVSGATTNFYYTRDHLGSIREMMDSNGTTIDARYSYDPYGRATQISGSETCDCLYAGMYAHSYSGLSFTPARVYNPNVGRWISRDPSGESSGFNLYAYCVNSPLNLSDESGLTPSGPGAIDYDGDPWAYAPLGSGLVGDDYLGNATRANGTLSDNVLVFQNGTPVISADGYYISKTSLTINGQSINGQDVAYVALGTGQTYGAKLGSMFVLTDFATGATSDAIFADSRGNNNDGVEMSPEAARELGLPFNKKGVKSDATITVTPGHFLPSGCMESGPSAFLGVNKLHL